MQPQAMLKHQKRSLRLDSIRILALLGAVGIHLVFPVYTRPDFLGGFSWWLAALVSAFGRMSIPLFIMLSGFLLLHKAEAYGSTALRAVRRLLIPLFTWFAFYAWWDGYYLSRPHESADIVSMMVMSNMFHLYFLVILFGLYLFKPMFQLVLAQSSAVLKKNVTLSLLFLGFLIYFVQYFVSPTQSLLSSFTIWLPYAGYFLFGATAPLFQFSNRATGVVAGVGLLLTMALSYVSVAQLGAGDTTLWGGSAVAYFDHFLSPVVILMSVAFFHLLAVGAQRVSFPQAAVLKAKLGWTVQQIAQLTFGVYLSHIAVLNIVDMRYGYAIEFLEGSLLSYLLGRSALALLLSFVLAAILRKIPLIRYTVGE